MKSGWTRIGRLVVARSAHGPGSNGMMSGMGGTYPMITARISERASRSS